MKNRTYIKEEDVTSSSGMRKGVRVFGENTTVFAMDHKQTDEQMKFVIKFTDFGGFGMSTRCEAQRYPEGLVAYGSDLIEDDTAEEFYKVALLLTKIDLIKMADQIEEGITNFEAGKHSWPIGKSNVEEYRKSMELDRKVAATIDVTENDLKYFKEYVKA